MSCFFKVSMLQVSLPRRRREDSKPFHVNVRASRDNSGKTRRERGPVRKAEADLRNVIPSILQVMKLRLSGLSDLERLAIVNVRAGT